MSHKVGYKTFDQFDPGFFEDYEAKDFNGHRKYITPDGNFPSMTTILSIVHGKDNFLDEWRERIGHEEADKITKMSCDRGEFLHKYCELYLQNILDRKLLKGQAKVLFSYIKRHLDLIDVVYGLETALYNKELENAGRADAIVGLHNKLTIVDFKNSRRKIVAEGWKGKKLLIYMLQITGYALALKDQYGLEAKQGCIIVGNHDTMNSDKFIFPINQFLIDQFKILNEAFHNDGRGLEKSLYFKL